VNDGSYLHFLTGLQSGLGTLQSELLSYFVAASAIGVTSMALIQTLKDQLPLRKWYQRTRLRQWIQEGLTSPSAVAAQAQVATAGQVEEDMIRLALDGDSKAFYSLEIEKLCGQLNAAAQSALQMPASHRGLLTVLASEVDASSLTTVLAGLPVAAGGDPLPSTDPKVLDYTAARSQVGQQIQRAIDALQLSITADWQVHLQQAALALSVILAVLGAHAASASSSKAGGFQVIIFTVFTGVLAGFLAPVARDLVAALQNLRS
jgi:hypothetical protein